MTMRNLIDKKENERAFRIEFFTAECHTLITNAYEHLVDREFTTAEYNLKKAILQIKVLLKSIEEDDF
jgi:hypothetical protein